ncbi:MAG: pyridoxamine 5'-phosphate oxidase family protein [Methanomassiliicoccaceae archaeon]|nr:pyridoxamine 5'-phosphate oxidase family protein [Methanomassiliicoccaceae archaeon]
MVKLTENMKTDLKKVRMIPFATATASGEPNVVPIAVYRLMPDDETFWVIDNFMKKTLENVKNNPRVSFYLWTPDTSGAYQMKGTITEVVNTGPEFEEAKLFAGTIIPGLPTKGLLKMKITDVYSVSPGPTAGEKLL